MVAEAACHIVIREPSTMLILTQARTSFHRLVGVPILAPKAIMILLPQLSDDLTKLLSGSKSLKLLKLSILLIELLHFCP